VSSAGSPRVAVTVAAMTTSDHPRHGAPQRPAGNPTTQEIPVVPAEHAEQPPSGPATGATAATRGGTLPAPGQHAPQPVVPPPGVHQPAPSSPPHTPPHGTAAQPPTWPDSLADEPSPPTRPATVLEGIQPTGPVDFVPGLPGVGSPAPPRHEKTEPRDRAALASVALAALAVVLLQLGLVDDDGQLWSRVTLWAIFATAATVLGLGVLAAHAATGRPSARLATRLVAGAVLALAIFWLLVVLPIVASDPGFLVTAALLALGGALWLGPARKRPAAH
jgi:hypothetical protein